MKIYAKKSIDTGINASDCGASGIELDAEIAEARIGVSPEAVSGVSGHAMSNDVKSSIEWQLWHKLRDG